MKRFYSLVCLIVGLGAFTASAQMTVGVDDGGTITIDCGDGALFEHTFEDDGGGGYGPNRDDMVTVCPDGTNGSKVTVRINADTENWQIHESDTLYIYDGPDNTWPLIGGFNLATDTFGIVRTASFNNPSGCLTFNFVSDGVDEGEFVGIIQCGYPCQPFTPYIASDPPANPGHPDTGYIDICMGDTVWMWAQAELPFSSDSGGIGYLQSLDNSTYEWELADGTTYSGDTIMVTPSVGAGYGVTMVMTDTLGCPQAGYNKIRVATTPIYSEVTEIAEDSICFNDTTYLLGGINYDINDTVGVDPVAGYFLNGGVFTGLTYLPDGSGVEYETTINITGFDSTQVIENASDVLDVCLTIEHSYLGDLEMSLTCPDGTEIVMFNSWTGQGISPSFAGGFGGGSIYLGDALDNSQGTPGVGWEYCFSESAVWGTMAEEFDLNNYTPTTISNGNAMSAGTYQPEESYSSFLGCPINGPWTITVRDNIGTDDGYIFDWGILFNPEINPNVESYDMEVDTAWWSPSPFISQFFGDTMIEVAPPGSGSFDFMFNVIDNFGCSHDTPITIVVDPPLQGNFGLDSICALEYDLVAADTLIHGSWTWTAPDVTDPQITWSPDSLFGNVGIEVNNPGDYFFSFESACGQEDTIALVFQIAPEPVNLTDMIVCPGDDITLDAGSDGLPVVYEWNVDNQDVQIIEIDSITESMVVTVDVSSDCGTETGTVNLNMNEIDVSTDDNNCGLTTDLATATNLYDDGSWTYETNTGGTATFDDQTSLTPTIEATEWGEYEFIYTDDLCATKDTVIITFIPVPEDVNWEDHIVCADVPETLNAGNNPDWVTYNWTPNTLEGQFVTLQVSSTNTISVEITNECGTANGEVELQVNTIDAEADPVGCNLSQGLTGMNFYDTDGEWTYSTQTGGVATFTSSATDLSPDVEVTAYGLYDFTYTEDQCDYTKTVQVEFFPFPEIAATNDTDICIKDTISFDAGEFYGVTAWNWEYIPEVGTAYSPFQSSDQIVMADNPGDYIITATGPCGVNDSLVVLREFDCNVVIPNVFNPNSTLDSNKVFMIPNLEFHPGNEVLIFDRWGRKVYEQTEYQNAPWDGDNRNSGVFYYILSMPQIQETMTGYVHLMSN